MSARQRSSKKGCRYRETGEYMLVWRHFPKPVPGVQPDRVGLLVTKRATFRQRGCVAINVSVISTPAASLRPGSGREHAAVVTTWRYNWSAAHIIRTYPPLAAGFETTTLAFATRSLLRESPGGTRSVCSLRLKAATGALAGILRLPPRRIIQMPRLSEDPAHRALCPSP